MTDKQDKNIVIEREDGITFLMLNRPDKRNAMSPELHYDMDDALDWLPPHNDTQGGVPRGKGDAWCAGQDLRLYFRATQDDPQARYKANNASHNWRWERLSQFPKATIAMVQGFAFGGAFTQLCACDFAIAAADATFGLSEVNWGIIPGGLVSWNLADMMLPRHALYYAVTGDTFDGKRAVEIGLANFAVPKAKLREETVKLAEKLMQVNPNVVRYTKEAVRPVRDMSDKQARDFLKSKQDSPVRKDKEIREQHG